MLFLIQTLSSFPSLSVLLLEFGLGLCLVILFFRYFKYLGLTLYLFLSVVVANIQVLKATMLPFFNDPIALGTGVFMTGFLATDAIVEIYGVKKAKKAIALSFLGFLSFSLFMILTIGVKPLDMSQTDDQTFIQAHEAISFLFTPMPSLLIASLVSYLLSQYLDVFLYSWIKEIFSGKYLALRAFISTSISAFVDNTVFSLLAWWVFAVHPISWNGIFYTYILGNYILRVVLALLYIPSLYFIKYWVKQDSSYDSIN